MNDYVLFDESGDLLDRVQLSGTPLVGDVLLVNNLLYEVVSRRWSAKGDLELILSTY